jgi:hypothetical protein
MVKARGQCSPPSVISQKTSERSGKRYKNHPRLIYTSQSATESAIKVTQSLFIQARALPKALYKSDGFHFERAITASPDGAAVNYDKGMRSISSLSSISLVITISRL